MMNAAVQFPIENLSVGHRQIRLGFIFDQEPKTSGDNDSNFVFFYFHREHEISSGNS